MLLGMSVCNIFIVESNPAVRQALAFRLQRSPNIRLVGSTDHPPKNAILYQANPDTIVYGLPIRSRRAKAFTSKMIGRMALVAPTIVLTQYVIEEERERYLQAGAQQYLLKQLNSSELISALCRPTRQS